MSTVFAQLMEQHMAQVNGQLSTESIETTKVDNLEPKGADGVDAKASEIPMTKDNPDESDLEIDKLIDVTLDETNKMKAKQDEWEEGGRIHASLESLLHGTIDAYATTGMNEQALNLYHLSVESALMAAGLGHIPTSAAVPSFEAADTQLAVVEKVEKKGKGILRTIIDWMLKAFRYIGTAVKKFIDMFRTNKKKVAERASRLLATIQGKSEVGDNKEEAGKEGEEASSGKGLATVKTEVKINAGEGKILSHGGTVKSLSDASDAIQKNYESAMREWGTVFDSVINVGAANKDPVGNLSKVSAELKSKLSNGFKKELNLNELLVVTPGKEKDWPMIGAKAQVQVAGDAVAGTVEIPSKEALMALVKTINSNLEGQTAAEKEMDKAADNVQKAVADYEKFNSEKDVNSSIDVHKATTNLMSATSVFTSGIALAGTHYVSGYNLLLNVVQRAIGSSAEAA